MSRIESAYSNSLSKRREKGLLRGLTNFEHLNAREVKVGGKTYVNFSSNDYLALSHHPALIEKSQDWLTHYGAGSGASRLVTGNLNPFEKIETRLAQFKGKEAALIMASGFQANGTVLQAILNRKVLQRDPLVFSDRLNHASIHFGCAAASLQQIRYRHCDLDHLGDLLEKHRDSDQPKFILTESVFSMNGDIAPLDEIKKFAQQHDAYLICDDAHATGILGPGGRGLSDHADLVIGTFSKAMGSFGAYVACSGTVRDYLINTCGGLIYSTALPPQVLGAIDAALDIVSHMDQERAHVASLAEHFRQGVRTLGLSTATSQTQIVPVIVGTADKARNLSDWLKKNGQWVTPIRPPTVPDGTARLRFAFTAAHTSQDVDKLLNDIASFQPSVILSNA